MNYLQKYLDFNTVEEGLESLKKAENIRDQMCGALYYEILTEDCNEIAAKLYRLECEERAKKEQS